MFSSIYKELQVLSCLCTAISCDSQIKLQGRDRIFGLVEEGDKSLKASLQRGAILINRSLSDVAVLLEGT